jgi:glycerophosphoryl diester phosphodiesterase
VLHLKDSPLPIRFSNTISNSQPLIIGHRGASALAPENTLAAFALAMDGGADGVELDVRLAQDGVPVVIHDATLRRTGLCKGIVAQMTSKELGQKDVGSWFNHAHPRLARAENTRQVVPTLDQVLRLFSKSPAPSAAAGVVYIELKSDDAKHSAGDLSSSVLQLINEYGLRSRVVVVSFNLNAISQIKQIDSAIRTGALFGPKIHPAGIVRKRTMVAAAVDSGADELLLHRMIARPGALRAAASSNLRVVVWTVDDPRWLHRARSRGIHALITNNPARLGRPVSSTKAPNKN